MSNSPRPERATWVTPYMAVSDVAKAAKFYEAAFGFEVLELAPGEDGSICHAELRYKDQLIMMGLQGAYGTTNKSPASSGVESPISLYIYCDNVDKFYEHAIANGAVSLMAPNDAFWGDRMCKIKDPEGFDWCFATCLHQQ